MSAKMYKKFQMDRFEFSADKLNVGKMDQINTEGITKNNDNLH